MLAVRHPGNQTWQKNVISTVEIYIDKSGKLQFAMASNQVSMDTNMISQLSRPLDGWDHLGLDMGPKVSQPLLIIQTVKKDVGFQPESKCEASVGDRLDAKPRSIDDAGSDGGSVPPNNKQLLVYQQDGD